MRDRTVGETFYFQFTTRAFATGTPTVLAGSPVVSAYEDAGLTQITAGITLGVDHDGVVGLNMLTLVATGGNGFEAGKDYHLVITAGTVGGVSVVGEVVGHFSLGLSAAFTRIGAAGAGLSNIGTIATVTTLTNKTGFSLAATGLDAISQAATGMIEIAKAVWDRLLTGGLHNINNSAGKRVRLLAEAGSYALGAVWIDTVNGVAGTTNFENGTEVNPVDNINDANTIAASVGLSRFELAAGSSITLVASQNNQVFNGHNWTLALGSQDVSGTHFFGAIVSGIGTGTSEIDFHDCTFNTCTLDPFHMTDCAFNEVTVTVGKAGTYVIHNSHSTVAGANTPVIDMGAAIPNVNLSISDWANGIEIRNLNNTGSDLFSISGHGQIIYAASSSGEVHQRGDWKVTNTGGVGIAADDNTTVLGDQAQAATTIVEGIATGTPTTTTMAASALTEDTDSHYNGRIIIWTSGVLKDQATDITGYVGATKTFTFTAVTEAATAGDTFVIL